MSLSIGISLGHCKHMFAMREIAHIMSSFVILRQSRRIQGICIAGCFALLSMTIATSAHALTSLEQVYLAAETTKNHEEKIEAYQKLINDAKAANNPAITPALLHQNILHAYTELYDKEQDIDHIQKAYDYIQLLDNPRVVQWGRIHLLHALAMQGRLDDDATYALASVMIDDLDVALRTAKGENANNLAYALVDILTHPRNNTIQFKPREMGMVHELITRITSAKQRNKAMQAYADAAKYTEPAYPQVVAPVYRTLQAKKVPSSQLVALYEQAKRDSNFDLALYALLAIDDKSQRPKKLREFFHDLMKAGEISRAVRIALQTSNPDGAVDMWTTLGIHYMQHDYVTQAEDAFAKARNAVGKMKKSASRAKAKEIIDGRYEKAQKERGKKNVLRDELLIELRKQALELTEAGHIDKATDMVRQSDDYLFRVKTFREIAEMQTRMNDVYKILPNEAGDEASTYSLEGYYTLGGQPIDAPASEQAITRFEKNINAAMNDDPSDVAILEAPASNIGQRIAHNPLPEKTTMDGDTFRTMIPAITGADVIVTYYENNIANNKFYGVYGNAGFVESQRTATPVAIVIENGVTDIPAIYDALKMQEQTQCFIKQGSIFLMRCPLVINNSATLVVTGDDVDALRLSTQYGAYIVNVGTLFMSDTVFAGWDEDAAQPKWATYKERRNFRPYYTAWSRSKTNIGNTDIYTLGYGNGKSYGISLSAGPNEWFKLGNRANINRPTGNIVDNSFNNTLYGFYSYEADDVILVGNEYINNIVYGIDPHDRSRRLVIAYNTAYDTQKKHGIIISREVNDSLIMGNVSFHNKGTGIMLDRDSNQTLVYGNTMFHNKQEGMTIFESDCEIAAANRIFDNEGGGFRIRNSYNIGLFYNDIRGNKNAIAAYTGKLKGDAVHAHRDFGLDPYDILTTVTMVGNHIEDNKMGVNIEAMDALYMKNNAFVNQSPKIYAGEWFKAKPKAFFKTDRDAKGVVLHKTCPDIDEKLFVQQCLFRKDGTLQADGQDQLIQRIASSACAKAPVTHEPRPKYEEH